MRREPSDRSVAKREGEHATLVNQGGAVDEQVIAVPEVNSESWRKIPMLADSRGKSGQKPGLQRLGLRRVDAAR
ncbi:MAG TPA: hypothetical protein VEZ11_03315, partial [Thermoanaerobaculia bacterium]|nr:hypothetical protein [Thermoanaerobaculia bacterium]